VGVGALWDSVLRVCNGGGGCTGGDVPPLGAVPVLFWCVEVSLRGIHIHTIVIATTTTIITAIILPNCY